jgi:hypothetical protein
MKGGPKIMLRISLMDGRNQQIPTHLNNWRRNRFAILITGFYVPFQVDIEEFKHQVELLICMHDIKQAEVKANGVEQMVCRKEQGGVEGRLLRPLRKVHG